MSCEPCPKCGVSNFHYRKGADGSFYFVPCGHQIPEEYQTMGQMAILIGMHPDYKPKEQRTMCATKID